ncbi:transposon Ty3-I Gag-Pol polyprotein [Trichonephila clavata]|uniref:Transposon Ty3-I Gag-Pol polyprotein n=1 Tax=Trichonephila clavata TaxID=2740835 RepID=A0A8X6HSP7_TRICU|nr:transposon Ty3-I Gag-Pol polyprotein [Trichonephila clavata]
MSKKPSKEHELNLLKPTELNDEQKSVAWMLIDEYEELFSCTSGDLGRTKLAQHRIETGNHSPIKQNPRRLPIAKTTEVKDLLRDMQERDVIEPSSSPWASPIVLTENKQKFWWTDECEEAFNSLKAALTSSPILVYPDPEKQFILDTDASHESVGAVLSQEINGQEHVIAYWSKCLSKPERNYCVTRKELLAIVKAVENFHSYLYGRKFLLRTDHASLAWLLNFKNTEGQIARWIQKLEEQQVWEDTLSTLSTEDNSLWGTARAFRRKAAPISALNGPDGTALSDTHKTDLIANSLERQFQINDIHNPHKDEVITNIVDAYFITNNNNTDPLPPPLPSEIINVIKNVKIKKSPGREGITNKMLKNLPLLIIFRITNIILRKSCKIPTIRQTINKIAINFFNKVDNHENPTLHEIDPYNTYSFIRRPRDILVNPDFDYFLLAFKKFSHPRIFGRLLHPDWLGLTPPTSRSQYFSSLMLRSPFKELLF